MEKQGHRETKASQRQKPTFAVAVNGSLAVSAADAAVNAASLVALALQVCIQQVQHLGHLHSHTIHGLRADPQL